MALPPGLLTLTLGFAAGLAVLTVGYVVYRLMVRWIEHKERKADLRAREQLHWPPTDKPPRSS